MPNPKGHENSIKDSRFKAAWQSGPTRTIRVPIALAEVTLEYARQLDQGIEPRDTVQSSDNETSSDDSEPRDTVQSSDNETSSDDSEPRDTREEIEAEFADLKQKSVTASELPEPEHIEFLKRLVAKKDPLISSDLWQEIERLKESHRRLRLKMGAERRESIEKTSDLEDWVKGLTRRIEEKQARLDELEAQLEQERASREEVEAELADLKQKSVTASELPEAADLLNKLKAKRKKSPVTLADIEAILGMIEKS
jgi:chromosome segregation ATPase